MKTMSNAMWLIIILLIPGMVFAFGYTDVYGNGSSIPGYNAVSLGLGGARSVGFGDALSILTNPAGIYRIPGTSFTMSIGPAVVTETFEDSTGRANYNWIALANLSAAMKFQACPELAIGAGIARITDFSFDGLNIKWDHTQGPDSGMVTEINELKVVGGLFESAAGFSWKPLAWMNIGLSGGLRFGQVDFDSTFEDCLNPENDTLVSWGWNESEFCWHSGIIIPLSLSSIGVSWASASEHYDSRVAAGAIMYTAESKQGAFGAEIEIIDPGDSNAFTARIFGQFHPSNSLTFRGALSFTDSGNEVEKQGIGLAVGTGISFGRLTLNGAYSSSFVEMKGIAFSGMESENIKDTSSLLSIGLTWNI